MRQYRLLLSSLLAISALGCFTSNSQAACLYEQVPLHLGQTVAFPVFKTPLRNGPGKKVLCQAKHFRGCLCHAEYCNSARSVLGLVLVRTWCTGL
jgi:hypothetical protein